MDRRIERKTWTTQRLLTLGAAALLIGFTVWALASRSGGTRLKVDPSRVTTAVVQLGEFVEYYPSDGTVVPVTSVYLDVEEGGRVDQIFVEGGQRVEQGDLILRFSNASLQRSAIDTETQLLENLDTLRNTEFNRAQSSLLLKDALLDLEYRILDLDKKHRRFQALIDESASAISREAYEQARDELAYLRAKRELLKERIRQEDILSANQLAQARESIERLTLSRNLLNRIVQSLEVRAPISGWLSTISAEVGQAVAHGQRIGQIDLLDSFKVRVRIDQYYISRVDIGTPGHLNLDGQSWPVEVRKIYPEVIQNAFEADVMFVQDTPESLKRGQSVTVELSFGAPSQGLVVSKGGFFQQTGGRWVYLIDEDGRGARRTEVRFGRQNPRQVEVQEGLREGDRIITSGYDNFNGADQLRFTEALKPAREG